MMDYREPRPDLYGVPATADSFNGMPYRRLGTSGLRVSNVGLGTWKIGYPETGDDARVGEKAALEIFDRAIELGVTFWDTANRYNAASGNSERIIGKWLKRNPDCRRDVVLATKICGGMDGRTPNHGGLSRAAILDSVDACLQRLEVDHVDLLYFHMFDGGPPAEESLAAVEDLVAKGLVRYFGVSNFTIDQIATYRAIERSASVRCRVLAVQNQFDILRGESPERAGVRDYCAEAGISFVAYSPLARGLLTNRYLDPSKAGPGDRLVDEGTFERDTAGNALERVRQLASLASKWGLSLSQLALAYMLTLPGMGPVIPSMSSVAQLESNAEGGKVDLDDEQRAQVRALLDAAPTA